MNSLSVSNGFFYGAVRSTIERLPTAYPSAPHNHSYAYGRGICTGATVPTKACGIALRCDPECGGGVPCLRSIPRFLNVLVRSNGARISSTNYVVIKGGAIGKGILRSHAAFRGLCTVLRSRESVAVRVMWVW